MRFFVALAIVGLLSACANDMSPDAPPEQIAAAAFREAGPKSISVITVVNNRTGAGGHSALKVKGSQTVIFDPAGSFRDPRLTEAGDVIYGVSPKWMQAYKSAHARETYHVVTQEIPVTPAQAEKALQLVMQNGSVPGAYCAHATTGILRQIEGFEGITQTFYPVRLQEQIAQLPGVRTDKYFENDKGDVLTQAPQ